MVAPRGVHLSAGVGTEHLLEPPSYPEGPAPGDVSNHSATSLHEATHAIIAQMDDVDDEDISHLKDAFTPMRTRIEVGQQEAGSQMTGVIATSAPKYGRLDQYEPIGEQIELKPALISQFDLIFVPADEPDEEQDRRVADRRLEANRAGEVNARPRDTHREVTDSDDVDTANEDFDPAVDPALLQQYIGYARENCHPEVTDGAQSVIQEFYAELRDRGSDEDAPVPITARDLDAAVRLAEASARMRLSDRVTQKDADRVLEIVRSCLEDLGVAPEVDPEMVETGTSKTHRELIQNLKALIEDIETEHELGAPIDIILERAQEMGMDPSKAEYEIEKLRDQGEVYEPTTDHIRTT